jgi:hypothetical protein
MRPTVVKATFLAVLVMCCLLVSGCSSFTHGVVTGFVRGYGGIASSTHAGGVYTGQPIPSQFFDFEDENGNRTTVTADADGHYSVSLPPGKYTMLCGPWKHIEVEARTTINLDCDFQML